MTIQEIALKKKEEYNTAYIKWCQETQKIMNGLSSKAIGANMASHCDTIEDLKTLIKVSRRLGSTMTGPHGHYFIAEACAEILEEYMNQEAEDVDKFLEGYSKND